MKLINAFVGAYQDYKSEKSAQLLKSMLKNEAIVIRDQKKHKIDASELVPGDIIMINNVITKSLISLGSGIKRHSNLRELKPQDKEVTYIVTRYHTVLL